MNLRKSQSALTPAEKQAFVQAVLRLKNNTPSLMGMSNRYDDYVMMHMDAMMAHPNYAHSGPTFLPWHREYIRRFESELGVALPYWDWTVDRKKTSSIWNPDFMGGNGRSSDHRVMNGPFAFSAGNWAVNMRDPGDPTYLRRDFGGAGFPSLPTKKQVKDVLKVTPYDAYPWSASPSLNSFRNVLEGWSGLEGGLHNRVHLWVGGNMTGMSSPNDPVFFLHHCNIDRVWAQWQAKNPSEGYHPTGVTGDKAVTGFNLKDPLKPWDHEANPPTPEKVLDHAALGYKYDTE